MITCSHCPAMLTGGIDTWGPMDTPCCMACWFALIDFHSLYDIEATYRNIAWLARSFAQSVAETRPLVPGFSATMLHDGDTSLMASELLAA